MVFSQTSHRTQSILNVVDIDRIKKENQENGLNGVIADGPTATPQPHCSFAEVSTHEYLKPEPVFESNMYHDTDYEFFQELAGWCSDPAKEEQAQIIDSAKQIEDRAFNTDTLHTPLSPGWDSFDANVAAQASFYTTTPRDPLSPAEGVDAMFALPETEQFVDIASLPVVIDQQEQRAGWDTYTKLLTHDTPFIDDDSQDLKYMASVTPSEVERCDDVITEYIVSPRKHAGLSLDVAARPALAGHVISTPEVLSFVEQLEQEKHPLAGLKSRQQTLVQETFLSPLAAAPAPLDYQPITPKSEPQADSEEEPAARVPRRRRRSEDSDEEYSPHQERTTPRKYKRRKPNIPLKDMILALEGSQQLTRARRGRPPKRRDSAVSNACSENSSMSTQDTKYRELRDKNNEASKRSRMHRKLKELQMEQEADQLEERNKKLRVQAGILEEMAKRLKDALLTSIMQK
ncbi:uncharacterized protein LOC134662017 isoform X1 [Cydia amplana]|uniref:uncharacterized protein LOC134662017 isoform X1 n=1 Tax=Cydia amplana TaxID=1869771 RepID=UPI002FE55785